ncbi:hypothetical protein C2G38_2224936 [Gigaspora rosea]|uniref:Restriction endonuclease n=1 Tax=Gigaspora rosea TaxID=44941 RepID=A0A397TZU3_9GLOM|nr:hypothetical protein C2G38_2224936 [Gigaspora rosea]
MQPKRYKINAFRTPGEEIANCRVQILTIPDQPDEESQHAQKKKKALKSTVKYSQRKRSDDDKIKEFEIPEFYRFVGETSKAMGDRFEQFCVELLRRYFERLGIRVIHTGKGPNKKSDLKGYLGVENHFIEVFFAKVSSGPFEPTTISIRHKEDDYKKLILLSKDAYNYIRANYSSDNLSPISKIKGEFNEEQWAELVGRRPDAVRKTYHHEIESLVTHLFNQNMDLTKAREKWYNLRDLAAPKYDDSFSYAENEWKKIIC